ncbi:MAG TPA: PEP-CTERM sorting domain-containing protein [Oligoflexia bacterium]|nr:PEP-CTERM sorting domain-containing protein [Oligoflexia bacterium]
MKNRFWILIGAAFLVLMSKPALALSLGSLDGGLIVEKPIGNYRHITFEDLRPGTTYYTATPWDSPYNPRFVSGGVPISISTLHHWAMPNPGQPSIQGWPVGSVTVNGWNDYGTGNVLQLNNAVLDFEFDAPLVALEMEFDTMLSPYSQEYFISINGESFRTNNINDLAHRMIGGVQVWIAERAFGAEAAAPCVSGSGGCVIPWPMTSTLVLNGVINDFRFGASGLILDNVIAHTGSTEVPEPMTMLLFGSGLLGIIMKRKTKENQVRIN